MLIAHIADTNTGANGVVVIASALHAEGPRFEPWLAHSFCICHQSADRNSRYDHLRLQ